MLRCHLSLPLQDWTTPSLNKNQGPLRGCTSKPHFFFLRSLALEPQSWKELITSGREALVCIAHIALPLVAACGTEPSIPVVLFAHVYAAHLLAPPHHLRSYRPPSFALPSPLLFMISRNCSCRPLLSLPSMLFVCSTPGGPPTCGLLLFP